MTSKHWVLSIAFLVLCGLSGTGWVLFRLSAPAEDIVICDASLGHCEAAGASGSLSVRVKEKIGYAGESEAGKPSGSGWIVEVQVGGLSDTPSVLLEGRDMFMGRFPVPLKPGARSENVYTLTLIAPLCTINPDMSWQLRVAVADQVWLVWLPPATGHPVSTGSTRL